MKEKDAIVDHPGHQLLLFVEKEDGSIGSVQTGSYMVKNYVDDFWAKRRNLEETLRKKLADNQISPVGFYMTLREMAEADLATRVGIPRGQLRKHLQPKHFSGMTLEVARRYSEVFGISVADLFQIPPSATPGKGPKFHQKPTSNPFVVQAEIIGDAQ